VALTSDAGSSSPVPLAPAPPQNMLYNPDPGGPTLIPAPSPGPAPLPQPPTMPAPLPAGPAPVDPGPPSFAVPSLAATGGVLGGLPDPGPPMPFGSTLGDPVASGAAPMVPVGSGRSGPLTLVLPGGAARIGSATPEDPFVTPPHVVAPASRGIGGLGHLLHEGLAGFLPRKLERPHVIRTPLTP